uniref:Uncharacterized protein n=1 Tax=Ciona intestinalis TaxID=7719 RepID=F7AKX5_CIOIN
MANTYSAKLVADCGAVELECENYWKDIIPRLVLHYSCCYTCKEQKCILPRFCFGSYYTWCVSYPTTKCYPYYYKYYTTYRYCRVNYYSGCYKYSKCY